MHQSLAQICRTQSQPAKRVEKMLEKQFAPYKKEVERLDAQKISAIIEGITENTLTNVPIPALIWFAVRNGGQDKELEFLRSERKQLNKENTELLKINSHYACRLVKEACKLRDKPCHFLRSSGLRVLGLPSEYKSKFEGTL